MLLIVVELIVPCILVSLIVDLRLTIGILVSDIVELTLEIFDLVPQLGALVYETVILFFEYS